MRHSLIGIVAVALAGGAVALTGYNLVNGGIRKTAVPAYAEFQNCGQGLREGGDVKLRGVLVGRIGGLQREVGANCRVTLNLFPESPDQIPRNIGAQIRAKTIFGEKWVELLYPEEPLESRIERDDTIPVDRTIDPLEIETILDTAAPILDAIDPQYLSGALTALAEGFVGQEEDAIRAIERGIAALKVINDNQPLVEEGIDQLAESGEVLEEVDDPLLDALRNLDEVNRFATTNQQLIKENLEKAPVLLRELSLLFEVRLGDLTKLANSGATVVNMLAARASDVDRLLDQLPQFNSNWIRNLNHVCRYRQPTSEPGKEQGDPVPGRCWRVHNIVSESRGPYEEGKEPRPRVSDYSDLGLEEVTDFTRILYKPALRDGSVR